jgi:hypothetical protein
VFDVAGLEGEHDILQYVKPNALAKDLQHMMECTTNGYPKQCMMRFPEVYSGEMMWDMLKSAISKASEEQGYTLRTIQCNKSNVSTKNATSGIAVIGWTYSLGCVRSRLYRSHQTMRSFVKDGDNHVFAQENKAALMKGNRNIEQRGPLGKTLPRKKTLLCLLLRNNGARFELIFTITNLTDTIICQPTAMSIISKRTLFVHITIMKDKRLFLVAGLTWTSMLRKW